MKTKLQMILDDKTEPNQAWGLVKVGRLNGLKHQIPYEMLTLSYLNRNIPYKVVLHNAAHYTYINFPIDVVNTRALNYCPCLSMRDYINMGDKVIYADCISADTYNQIADSIVDSYR